VVLGPVDEVAHDQEVAGEPHLQDDPELELQPLLVARAHLLALCRVGEEQLQAFLQPLVGGEAEVLLDRHAVGRGEVRQARLAEFQREVAAARDLQRVGHRRGDVLEQRLHLRLRLEVLLAREAAQAARVGQDLALGDAHARLVGLVVVFPGELHRVRGHHRQVQACGQLHGGGDVRLVVGAAGALQLDVEAVREHTRQPQRELGRPALVAGGERLAERAGLRARQQDEALVEFLQPLDAAHALRAHHVAGPGARQQFAQVQVALAALHQQHHARHRRRVGAQALQHGLAADHGLDALAAAFLVELDGAEQVVQVGDGERRLAVRGGRLHDLVDAVGAVDDGEFGVQAQVDEHALIVGKAGGALPLDKDAEVPPGTMSGLLRRLAVSREARTPALLRPYDRGSGGVEGVAAAAG